MNNNYTDKLIDLPNIGPLLSNKLRQAGITTPQQLSAIGAENCFLKLKQLDEEVSLYTLYALEGAIAGIKRHLLNTQRRIQLKTFFDVLKQHRKVAA